MYVRDENGNRLLDGLAGLWSVSLGYNQERIVQAATNQMRKLPYSHSFWNHGHDVGYQLADELSTFIPFPVEKIAFTGGGSDANDTAIKFAWFYNNALGRVNKKKIIARNKAYHGVTGIASSLSGLPGLHTGFGAAGASNLPLPGFVHLTCPHLYRFGHLGETEEEFSSRLVQEFEDTVEREGAETIAAFIAEPLMGAGGVYPPPQNYLEACQSICHENDILFIADEVVCGFGRLGEHFGSQLYHIVPDMITMAKALTSSYIPMGAVAISPQVAEVLAEGSAGGILGHGYTYGGHPVSCAVALECLHIYEEEGIRHKVQERAPQLLEGLHRICKGSAIVGEVRGRGLIAAIEFVRDRETRQAWDPAVGVGAMVGRKAREKGVIVRVIGDVVAMSPPLIIQEGQVEELLAGLEGAIQETESELRAKGLLPPSSSSLPPLFSTSLQLHVR